MTGGEGRRHFEGVWATLLLPVGDDGGIDWTALRDEVEILAGSGLHGIYSNGTAGEFYNQTEDEYDRVQALLAEVCHRRGTAFQIGASHMSPRISLERLRRAKALGPAAFQIILPDWFLLAEPEMVDFLQAMAEAAAPVPLILYNPPHGKQRLDLLDLARLAAAEPKLVGVKIADGDDAWYATMRAALGSLSVFIPGHHMATGRLRGASGSYSNVACLSPSGAVRWWNLIARDPEAAVALERRIVEFIEAFVLPLGRCDGFSNQALDKLLAAAGGWGPVGPRLMWPYRGVSVDCVERLRAAAWTALPELLSIR